VENVERGFVGGLPPHHLPEAQEILYTNQKSRIFITTPAKLRQLTPRVIQEIFRHRHILITGLDHPPIQFNRDELSRLGSLNCPRDIQGLWLLKHNCIRLIDPLLVNPLKSERNSQKILHRGSLLDLLPGPDGKPVRGLNILDISMGGSNVPKPPLYRSGPCHLRHQIYSDLYSRELASNEEAWQEAREERGINTNLTFPSDEVVWATASTRDSMSLMHLNDHGFGTSIKVITGLKYWVLAHACQDGSEGDLGSSKTFLNFSSDVCHSAWNFEGVLLGPSDLL
jgi:hypothetical protein